MKKIIIFVLSILSCISNVNAQNYNEYLSVARQHLAEGNIEKAQNAYSVYCDLSGLRDLSFEHDVVKNAWKAQCYIIEYSDSTILAVQKPFPSQVAVSYDSAKSMADSSRLGGFTDWRLPHFEEMSVISNLFSKDIRFKSFWLNNTITAQGSVSLKTYGGQNIKSDYVFSIYSFYEDGTQKTEQVLETFLGSTKKTNNRNFLIIRHFYKNDVNRSAYKVETYEGNLKAK